SIDRFDLERGVEFSTYATPTIVGEIKRHFRDKGWAVRVPRRLQELKLSLTKAVGDLSQREGRSPTVAELATHLQMSDEAVLAGAGRRWPIRGASWTSPWSVSSTGNRSSHSWNNFHHGKNASCYCVFSAT